MIVEELKKSILNYAITGLLSKQNDDEKCNIEVETINNSELFNIPNNWKWLKVKDVGDLVRGNGIKRTETTDIGIQCIRYGEIYTNYSYSFKNSISFVSDKLANNCKNVKTGDILLTLTGENEYDIAKATAYLGENRLVAGGDLAIFTNHHQNPLYLSYYFASPFAIKQKANTAKGNIIVHTSTDKIGDYFIPVPPIEEQQRIVDKIEELFAKLEELKTIEGELELLKNYFPRDMKKSILFSAISGKLSVQNNNDTPVDNQLEKIKRETEQFYLLNKIKNSHRKDHDYKFFTDDKYVIPTTWKYVPLSSTCLSIFSGKSPKYVKYKNDNLIIGQKVNQEDGLHFDDLKYGTDEFIKSLPKYQFLIKNDVLLNTLGGGSVGRCGIFDNDTSNITTDGHIFVIRTAGFTNEKYIMYFLRLYREKLEDYANGTTNQKFFSVKQIEDVMIPLPPIEEQQRIVDKLEQLLPLCDDIEKLIN